MENKPKLRRVLTAAGKYILIMLAWLGLWQLAHAAAGKSVLLPSPRETVAALIEIARGGLLWRAVGGSMLRITAGFFIGMAAGCLLAAVTSLSSLLRSFFHPLLVITKTTPVASFIILAVVWLKTGRVPVFTVALIVAPIFWSNVFTGVVSTDRDLVEMANMYRFSRRAMLTKLYIPSVMPYFYSAVRVGIGMAWKSGVAAEVICNPNGSIGGGLYESKIYLETDRLFAWTVVVIILSLLLERLMIAVLDRTVGRRWRYDKAE